MNFVVDGDPDGCDGNNPGKKDCDPREHFVGTVTNGTCVQNGVTVFGLGGTRTWNGVPGYTFKVDVREAGPPPAVDSYEITITAPDGSTTTYFVRGDVTSGNITAVNAPRP